MLAEAFDNGSIQKCYLAVGYTDLRKGIDSLAQLIDMQFHLDPFEKGTLFLFCGRRSDRIKGLLWEGTGYLLLYKRLEAGTFSWPRSETEAACLTRAQYTMLMQGLNPVSPKIREIHPTCAI